MARPIKIEILADERDAKRGFSATERGLSGLTKAAGLAGAAIAGGLAVGTKALFSIGATFETVRGNITRGTGAIGADLERFVDNAKAVLRTVPESADVVSSALADVNTFFGLTGDDLEEATRQYLDFARVTEVEVGTAIAAVDGVMQQFSEDIRNNNEVMGDLLRISQATGVGMEDLLKNMENFGPIFANANFSLEETVAFMGQLEQGGINIAAVGPALNAFFRRTAAAGEEPRRAFANIVTEIKNAEDASVALNIATDAFGSEGAQRLSNAIRTGAVDLADLNDLMGRGVGLVQEQADATKTLGDRWNEFKNRALVGLEPIATAFFDALEQGIERITPLIDPFVEKLGEIAAWFVDDAAPALNEWKNDFERGLDEIGGFISRWRDDASRNLGDVNDQVGRDGSQAMAQWRSFVDSARRAWGRLNDTLDRFGIDVGQIARNTLVVMEQRLKLLAAGALQGVAAVGLIGRAIVNAFSEGLDIINSVADAWNRLVASFNVRIKPPDIGGIFDGITGLLPGRRRATGINSHQGGRVRVGERGPENVDLPAGARVRPAHLSRSDQGGGDTYIINGSNLTAAQVASEIAWRKRLGDGR